MLAVLLMLSLVHPARADWKLVWADNFSVPGKPSPKYWRLTTGGDGWGNDEAQFYTSRPTNAWVRSEGLTIDSLRENFSNNLYTSARLVSRESWIYGRFEVRAKLPVGRGTWPAIWMMPAYPSWNNGSWPDNGEIDIMEHVGFDYGVVHGSAHMKSFNWMNGHEQTATIRVPRLETEFHTYAIEWNPEAISFFVDETRYFTYTNPHQTRGEWPFDQPFYFILNTAVGGNWGGQKGIDDAAFPQRMTISSVKVFQDAASNPESYPAPSREPTLRDAGAVGTSKDRRGGKLGQ
ncbi:MAG: glycoside hydrolase family 16 protein [Bdellovibrionota bacterium]